MPQEYKHSCIQTYIQINMLWFELPLETLKFLHHLEDTDCYIELIWINLWSSGTYGSGRKWPHVSYFKVSTRSFPAVDEEAMRKPRPGWLIQSYESRICVHVS